jgi:diguanylate cyclase
VTGVYELSDDCKGAASSHEDSARADERGVPVHDAPLRSLGQFRVIAVALSALLCVGTIVVAVVTSRLLKQHGDDATMLLGGTAVLVAAAVGLIVVFFVGSRRYQRRLRVAATTDALTDLPNRGTFLQRAAAVLQDSIDHAATAVLMLDLDHLKAINDALGNDAGDRLLAAVGPRLATVLRSDDLVGRLGSDEFAVLIRGTRRPDDVASIADRLLAALNRPFDLGGISIGIEASIGIAMVEADVSSVTELLKQAGAALYAAKRERAAVMFYRPDLVETTPERLDIVSRLRQAVENNEFVVHYQPKFEIATGFPVGVESLVRWAQPGGNLVPPMEFIPIAEQSAVIHALTRSVLDASVRQCRAWLDLGWRLPVAVNVSANCFLDRSFADSVQAILNHYRVPPNLLTLEITETAIVADPDRVRTQLAILRLVGVSVALDDVGVGSSTLSNLKTLPIDELKIDRSLVSNMTTNAQDAALVRAVLDIGRGLDLRVVAEGAEDSETCDALMAMGCVYAQGFQWMRPMPAEELNLFLATAMERVQQATDAKP